MSELRKGFAKCKVDIPPAACGDTKWRGAAWSLPWRWISGRWFGARCNEGGRLVNGALSWDLCVFFHLVALPMKSENINDNCEGGPLIPKKLSLSG